MRTLTLLLASLGPALPAPPPPPHHTGVGVARCRAHCLDSFRAECFGGEDSAACSSCWAACGAPEVCGDSSCGPGDRGCEAGCGWHRAANTLPRARAAASTVWDLASPLRLERGCGEAELSWGKVQRSANSFRSSTRPQSRPGAAVAVVVAEDGAGRWWEVAQVAARRLQLGAALPPGLATLRLVVVGEEGVRLAARLAVEDAVDTECEDAEVFTPEVTGTEEAEAGLVRVSLAWADLGAGGYTLRWGAVQEPVLATLLAPAPAATLTLQPGHVYRVQVEHAATRRVSRPLLLDTRRPAPSAGSSLQLGLGAAASLGLVILAALGLAMYSRRCSRRAVNQSKKMNVNNNEIVLSMDANRVPLNLDYHNLL